MTVINYPHIYTSVCGRVSLSFDVMGGGRAQFGGEEDDGGVEHQTDREDGEEGNVDRWTGQRRVDTSCVIMIYVKNALH